jgi:predicted transcriptional regulator
VISTTGQEYLGFLAGKGYLSVIKDEEKTTYIATEKAAEYIALFSRLYRSLFDEIPGFKL